jgi:hypothetical protein
MHLAFSIITIHHHDHRIMTFDKKFKMSNVRGGGIISSRAVLTDVDDVYILVLFSLMML